MQSEDWPPVGERVVEWPSSRSKDVTQILMDALVSEAVRELDLPHLMRCLDVETGIVAYSGPYENALAAACAAQRDSEAAERADLESSLAFSVAPLFAPLPEAP